MFFITSYPPFPILTRTLIFYVLNIIIPYIILQVCFCHHNIFRNNYIYNNYFKIISSLNESDLKNCLKRKHIKKILFICCVTVPAILIITFSVRLYLWNNLQKQVYSNIEMNTDPNTIYSIGDELNGNQTK